MDIWPDIQMSILRTYIAALFARYAENASGLLGREWKSWKSIGRRRRGGCWWLTIVAAEAETGTAIVRCGSQSSTARLLEQGRSSSLQGRQLPSSLATHSASYYTL